MFEYLSCACFAPNMLKTVFRRIWFNLIVRSVPNGTAASLISSVPMDWH